MALDVTVTAKLRAQYTVTSDLGNTVFTPDGVTIIAANQEVVITPPAYGGTTRFEFHIEDDLMPKGPKLV